MKIDHELFRTGVPMIDRQHEAYLELVERVFQLCAETRVDRARLAEEVNGALRYAVEHFDTEEGLMRSVQYPLYHQHVAKHNGFRAKVDLYAADVEDARVSTADLTVRLAKWLVDWFTAQVQDDDLRLATFLKRKSP
jgi:hemerythrin